MKKMGIFAALLFTFGSYAQNNVTYKVIKDDPKDVANAFLNIELLQMEMPIKNIAGGMAFCLGGNVYANYHNKFGGEMTFRRGWLNLFGVPRTQFELGGFYNFSSRTKMRSQRVVLDYKRSTSGNTTYESTKFIMCPAQNMRSLGVRAGFLTNKEGYEDERADLSPSYIYRWSGVYAGILLTSQMNYRINTDSYGEAGTGFIRRYYADVCIHPFASLTDLTTGQKNTTASIGRLGFRVGVEAMPANRRKEGQGPIYIKIEAGMRPLDGAYLMCAFGMNFKRKLPGLGVQETKRETE